MATNIAKRPPETASLPQLSKTLSDVLADRVEGFCGEHGYDTRPARWQLTAVVSDAARDEARRALDALAPLTAAATRVAIVPWISRLGAMTGAPMTADEARVKAELLASNLAEEYPAGVFTPETMRAAAKAFKWFPSYAELCERLDLEARKLRRLKERLSAVAGAGEQKAARSESLVRSAVRRMPEAKASDAKPHQTPEKASAVVHPASPEQIEQWAKAVGA